MHRLEEINKRKMEIRSLLESGEKIENLDELEKELRSLNDEQTEIQRRQQIADGINAGTIPSNEVPKPAQQRSKGTSQFDTPEYRRAFMEYVCRGKQMPVEYRADENTTTGDIGALVPPVVLNKIIEKIEAYGMILPLVTKTAYKTGMSIPVASVKPKASWVSEGATSEKQKMPLDTAITFGHFKLRVAVSVSLEVDNMALSAFETRLIASMSEAMAKALEQAILTGTGNGQPTGILHDADKGEPIQVKAVDYKTLVSAEAALPMEYENGAVWAMSKKTFMAFVGMTDTAGQPIARTNYGIGGLPERTLLGRKVVLTNYLPSYTDKLKTTDVFAMLYDFGDYTLNTNFSIGIKTYEDNETDDIIRKSIMVCDGKPVLYDSLVKLTGTVTA